ARWRSTSRHGRRASRACGAASGAWGQLGRLEDSSDSFSARLVERRQHSRSARGVESSASRRYHQAPMPSSTTAFDIEVAGFPWEEVDEITRGYLLSREGDKDKREAIPDRTGLYPGLGKIIAIGMWLVAEDRGLILLEGKSEETRDWKKVPNAKNFRGDEAEIPAEFWKLVARTPKAGMPRLVSFNGRGYDGPMLSIRSAQLGVKPSRNLLGNRYSIAEHCDLMEVFSFMGVTRERYSLEYWCRRFD